ncbi:hypothetical protein TVTCOM_16520 [Terrisporobacter vanillatitrophus]
MILVLLLIIIFLIGLIYGIKHNDKKLIKRSITGFVIIVILILIYLYLYSQNPY